MASLIDDKMTPAQRAIIIDDVRGKLPIDYSKEMTIIPLKFEERSMRIPVRIKDRECVQTFFGEFYKQKGGCIILYKTTAEWNEDPTLISKTNIIYVYLDGSSYEDDQGNTVYVPTIKLGDNETPLIDQPFLGDATRVELFKHITSNYLHFLPGEREMWRQEISEKVSLADVNTPIEIETDTGTFTEDQVDALAGNLLKMISYNGNLYKMSLKNGNVWRYTAQTTDVNECPYIDVNITTGNWACSTAVNQELLDHINDNVRHITAEERSKWNDKLHHVTVNDDEQWLLDNN